MVNVMWGIWLGEVGRDSLEMGRSEERSEKCLCVVFGVLTSQDVLAVRDRQEEMKKRVAFCDLLLRVFWRCKTPVYEYLMSWMREINSEGWNTTRK